ncbi:unnamed protein product [Closterium sp. Yama58-4]|nr:unnamed protein product [Closterium sp. Yama58-4]
MEILFKLMTFSWSSRDIPKATTPYDATAAKAPPKIAPGRRELNGANKAIQKARRFNVFLINMKKTNLDTFIGRYADRQPLTFLMPRDEAFSALPANIRQQLSGKKLVQLIQYHMLMEKAVRISSVRYATPNTASVISGDIGGMNTFLRFACHGIDKVIIPPGVFT